MKLKIKNTKKLAVKIVVLLAGLGLILTTFLPFLPYLL